MRLQIRRRVLPSEGCVLGSEVHPVLRRVYAARGIRMADELTFSLERLLPVSSLEGVEAAVELLLQHRAAGRVLIVGDFDADGATSTALMVRALRAWGFASVDFLVPNRFAFGYGLPMLLHYGRSDGQPSRTWSLAPLAGAGRTGVSLLVAM